MVKCLKISDSVALGLHACILIGSAKEKLMQAHDISEAIDVSYDHLSKVLQTLVKHGILISRKGKSGGFVLAVFPEKLQLKQIYEAIEGPMVFDHCLFGRAKCSVKQCTFGKLLVNINTLVVDYFTNTKLSDLLNGGKK